MTEEFDASIGKSVKISAFFRWAILFAVSFVVLTVYYAYDCLTPIGNLLKQDLDITAAQFGVLKQTAVSIPNLIMLIFGGMVIDHIGTRLGGGLFAGVCLLGTLITAIGGEIESYTIMFAGRMVFGSGVEALIIAQNKIIAKYFREKELALAFGINLAICRLGTLFAFTTMNGLTKALEWKGALCVIVGFMAVGFMCFLLYTFVDRWRENKIFIEEEKSDHIDFTQVMGLPRSFWYIVVLCVTFYCAVFPFLDFAPQIFTARFDMEREYASPVAGTVILLTIIFTPFFGWLCDRIGKRATMMIIGSLILIPIHLSIGFLGGCSLTQPREVMFSFLGNNFYNVFPFNAVDIVPILPVMFLGIAFSLVPAAMWPSVARMVEQKRLGTAYGIMFLLQNVGLMIMSPVVGWGEKAGTISGLLEPFQLSALILAALGVVGTFFAVLLKLVDKKAIVSIEEPEKRKVTINDINE